MRRLSGAKRPRAFTMPEVLVSTLMLGSLAVAVAPLTTRLNRAVRDAGDNGDGQRMMLQVLEQLRYFQPSEIASQVASWGCVPAVWNPTVKRCDFPTPFEADLTSPRTRELSDPLSPDRKYARQCILCNVNDSGFSGSIVRVRLRWYDGVPPRPTTAITASTWPWDGPVWETAKAAGRTHERMVQLFRKPS